MNNQFNVLESLIGNSKEYAETRLNLIKLKAVDKSSDLVSSILMFLPLIIIFLLVFFLLNIGIALLIGDLVGRASWGFLILTGIYLITGVILFSARNKILKVPIANMLIRKFLKDTKI